MNPQPFKFHSYDEFFEHLTKEEKLIVSLLDSIIQDLIPGVKRKLSYNVPYYSVRKRICFIWPSSIPWGKVKMNGVQLGFCTGYLLDDSENFLEKENRKQVYAKTFFSANEIEKNLDIIRYFLLEAAEKDKI